MDTETEQSVMGRPTIYTPELRAEFCRRLAGGRTKRSVCRDDDMPDRDTIERWLMDLPNEENKGKAWIIDDFYGHYAQARGFQAENVHDEIIDIADDSTNDYIEVIKKQKNGDEKKTILFDKEAVMRSKLRVDARLAWLANTDPRKYGKNIKVDSQLLGKDGKPTDPNPGMSSQAFMDAAAEAIEKATKKDTP